MWPRYPSSSAVALWLKPLSMTGKGWKAERLLCSLSGCLSECEELRILLGSSTQCLLCAVRVYKCLVFRSCKVIGCSEVFMQLRCWGRGAVVMSSVRCIFIFGANDPADSVYRRCQPDLFFFLSIFFVFHLSVLVLALLHSLDRVAAEEFWGFDF